VGPAQTDRFRETLLAERQRVVDAIANLHDGNGRSGGDDVDEAPIDNHLGENASFALDRELDSTLEENCGHVLAAIDSALERIESGTFGTCRTCGGVIAEARLEALPYATQCIDCKRRAERG
jgi:RNA polymerase-binding protein DksA